jgi:hypothetical protein
MLDLDADALAHEFGDALAMTVGDVTFITEQADTLLGLDDGRELDELLVRIRCRQMFLIDAKEIIESSAPGGEPSFLWGAEATQVQIANAAFVESGGELTFGKPRPARCSDRASVNDERNAGAL